MFLLIGCVAGNHCDINSSYTSQQGRLLCENNKPLNPTIPWIKVVKARVRPHLRHGKCESPSSPVVVAQGEGSIFARFSHPTPAEPPGPEPEPAGAAPHDGVPSCLPPPILTGPAARGARHGILPERARWASCWSLGPQLRGPFSLLPWWASLVGDGHPPPGVLLQPQVASLARSSGSPAPAALSSLTIHAPRPLVSRASVAKSAWVRLSPDRLRPGSERGALGKSRPGCQRFKSVRRPAADGRDHRREIKNRR